MHPEEFTDPVEFKRDLVGRLSPVLCSPPTNPFVPTATQALLLQDTAAWLAWVNYLGCVDAERLGAGAGVDPEMVHTLLANSCGRTHTSDWISEYCSNNTVKALAEQAIEAASTSVLRNSNLDLPFNQAMREITADSLPRPAMLSSDLKAMRLQCDIQPLDLPQIPLLGIQQLCPETLCAMEAALQEFGCFMLDTEGAEGDHTLARDSRDYAKTFFEQSEQFKNKFDHDAQQVYPKTSRGFCGTGNEMLHPDEGPCHKEIFDLGLESAAVPDPRTQPFTGPNLLPSHQELPGFKRMLLKFQRYKHQNIIMPIVRAMDVIHNTEATPHSLEDQMYPPTLLERLIYYPEGEAAFAGRHTDNGLFTLLYFDGSPPQLEYKGRWKNLNQTAPGTVMPLVQTGDMYEWWTSELCPESGLTRRCVATPHRVQMGAAAGGARIAMADFVYPNAATLEPMVSLSGELRVAGQHMLQNFNSIWEDGTGAGAAVHTSNRL